MPYYRPHDSQLQASAVMVVSPCTVTRCFPVLSGQCSDHSSRAREKRESGQANALTEPKTVCNVESVSLSDWFEIQVILVKTGRYSLKRRVQEYNHANLSIGNARRAATIINDLSPEELNTISKAAKVFYLWTIAGQCSYGSVTVYSYTVFCSAGLETVTVRLLKVKPVLSGQCSDHSSRAREKRESGQANALTEPVGHFSVRALAPDPFSRENCGVGNPLPVIPGFITKSLIKMTYGRRHTEVG
eukprot:sb/3468907/